MAEDLDDGEFWLPPQFLTEEDILMGFETNSSSNFSSSDLGSPVDSITETESDDDDSVIARRIALSSIDSVSVKKGTGYFDSTNRGLNSPNPNFQFQQNHRRKSCPPASTWHANRKPNPPGSGMRAVFLGSTGSKRESVGTGVFLPRIVNPVEPHKKTKNGCAAVLVPEKVVQALNNIKAQSQSRLGGEGDNNGRRPEIRLPSEWTY